MNVEDSDPAFMVGWAIMDTMNAHKHMTKDDILLRLRLAKFTSTLSIKQRKQFGLMLKLITKRDESSEHKYSQNKTKTKTVQLRRQ